MVAQGSGKRGWLVACDWDVEEGQEREEDSRAEGGREREEGGERERKRERGEEKRTLGRLSRM
jgi:hypothetical protein